MKRTPLSSIRDRAVAFREPIDEPGRANEFEATCERYGFLVMYDVATGVVIGSVDRDDLFDQDGHRFENDD